MASKTAVGACARTAAFSASSWDVRVVWPDGAVGDIGAVLLRSKLVYAETRAGRAGAAGALVAEAGTHDLGKRPSELRLVHGRLVRGRPDAHPVLGIAG